MQETNAWLIEKIEAFIARYYKNKLLKGSLIVVGCILLYLLILLIGEYFFYFPPWLKVSLLSISGGIALYAIVKYMAIPLFQMMKIGKRMTTTMAAKIIGTHFPEIGDKLVNVLQLQSQAIPFASKALIEASIQQKSQQLSPFQFAKAVNISQNKKWLPLALIPIFIGALVYFFNPKIITQSSNRLINATTQFAKPAPFRFQLLTEKLEVVQYGNLPIRVALTGDAIPTQLQIKIGDELINMSPDGKNEFSYTIKKIEKPLQFKLAAAGYESQEYTIQLKYQASLKEGKVSLKYPSYTGRVNEEILGLSDLTVPEGTEIVFYIDAQSTTNAALIIDQEKILLEKNTNNLFTKKLNANKDFEYTLELYNNSLPFTDPNHYLVQVVKDNAPQVSAQEVKEKITGEQIVLTGQASDDYGLSKAAFVYVVIGSNGKTKYSKSLPLTLSGKASATLQQYFDFASIQLTPGDKVNYYFEVWDNDAVNGSKRARSTIFEYKTIRIDETQEALKENQEELNKSLAAGKEKMKELDEQLKKMQEQTVQNKEMTAWEKKQNMDLLQNQQEVFKEKLEEIQKRMEHQKELIEQNEYNEDIKEKQEQLDKQVENMLQKELSEQMKKLQELLERKNNEMNQQELQQMQQQNSLFQMDMERLEAMIEQLEAQMMMEDMANKLEELAQKQDVLNERTSENTAENQQLQAEQEKLEKELEKLMKEDFPALEQKAKNSNLSDEKKDGQDAGKEMENSAEQLEQKQNSNSKQSQKNASNKLKKMSKSLNAMAAGMDMEQIDIDIQATRQLLTNLLRLSFEQEELLQAVKNTDPSAEYYKELTRKQYQLKKSSTLIKDSLFALSKRVMQLGPTINKETVELEKRLNEAVHLMENRQSGQATVNQQYAMTSTNNLALILNDLLSNLLQQQASTMQGSGEGQGQGQGKGKGKGKSGQGGDPGGMMKDIITGQQGIGKGLKQLMQEQGNNPGGKGQGQGQGQSGNNGNSGNSGSQGNTGNQNGNSTSEQLSRIAYEQSKLRQKLLQLNSIMNSKGIKGNAKLMKEIMENMDKIETDLINRKLDPSLLEQQNNILTRLLEAENVIREQEQDNQREAEIGKDKPRPIPAELQKHIDEVEHLKEFYRTTPPELKPFYKRISDKYLEKVAS